MDFSLLNLTEHSNRGAVLDVVGPDGRPLEGVSIRLLGADSTIGRAAQSLMRKGKTLQQLQEMSLEDQYKKTTDKIVALTVSWSGIEMNGAEYKCTPENVRELYENPGYEWLRIQVIEFVNGPSNFFVKADGA